MGEKSDHVNVIFLLIAVIVITIFAVGLYYIPGTEDKTVIQNFQVPTKGYSTVDVEVDEANLYLSTECYQLSMGINNIQALSIKRGLEKKIDVRPLTHDIMRDVMDNFDISVLAARIESFDSGIYYAKLILRQKNKVLDIDSRPSDAVATAVRAGVPVYIKDELLVLHGDDKCGLEKQE